MFKILIETSTIQVNDHNVIANFWIEYDGFSFPEKNWSDFVLPVLLWWSDEALKIDSKHNESLRFLFMDGTFEFIIKTFSSQADIIDIAFCVREEKDLNVLKTISIDKKEFINDLISKNLELINSLNSINGTKPKDLAKLIVANKKLSTSQGN